ncbi:Rrf2 family transcriptional regulator [Brevibacillus fluminis]|uniref:Rrf2 family transcriptional regulator n=1 Tax=Brevibacillus fluminis TaxID=511487 RepID=A0A3M8D601_9BACL|nr:Rrf2 family transcriptional regulator [Brevibacillus fluminis]RNB83338.1 Rrf2 family transcriptional regulator [Brevibacillus fluminis]
MKISSRFTVGVHILSLLATSPDGPCTSEWIAGSVNTNPVIIRRLTGQLKKAGLVNVRPGTGGAYLVKDASAITLLDVYRAVEVVEEGQLFHFHEEPNPECMVGANIQAVLQLILLRAQSAMEQILADVTLKELVTTMIESKSTRS